MSSLGTFSQRNEERFAELRHREGAQSNAASWEHYGSVDGGNVDLKFLSLFFRFPFDSPENTTSDHPLLLEDALLINVPDQRS